MHDRDMWIKLRALNTYRCIDITHTVALGGNEVYGLTEQYLRVDTVSPSDKYLLKDFTFENIDVTDDKGAFDYGFIEGITVKDVVIKARP